MYIFCEYIYIMHVCIYSFFPLTQSVVYRMKAILLLSLAVVILVKTCEAKKMNVLFLVSDDMRPEIGNYLSLLPY